MSVVTTDPIFLLYHRRRATFKCPPKFQLNSRKPPLFMQNCTRTRYRRTSICSRHFYPPKALSSPTTTVIETSESSNVTFTETFPLKGAVKLEGKITVKLESENDEEHWKLTVGCSLPGKWVLHWGVNYISDTGSEWDQPPLDMRPPGSVSIKDYAIETPFERLPESSEGDSFYEVKIDFNTSSSIAAINFVLKDEETGSWYQHRGRDFKVPLIDYLQGDGNIVEAQKGAWPGSFRFMGLYVQT